MKKFHILDELQSRGIDSINAGYRTYALEVKKAINEKGDSCWGICDFHKGYIHIIRGQDHESARETLVHEMTHLVLEMVGLGAIDDDDNVRVKTNEEITTLVSRGWLLLMNLNPELFELIQEQPDDE